MINKVPKSLSDRWAHNREWFFLLCIIAKVWAFSFVSLKGDNSKIHCTGKFCQSKFDREMFRRREWSADMNQAEPNAEYHEWESFRNWGIWLIVYRYRVQGMKVKRTIPIERNRSNGMFYALGIIFIVDACRSTNGAHIHFHCLFYFIFVCTYQHAPFFLLFLSLLINVGDAHEFINSLFIARMLHYFQFNFTTVSNHVFYSKMCTFTQANLQFYWRIWKFNLM